MGQPPASDRPTFEVARAHTEQTERKQKTKPDTTTTLSVESPVDDVGERSDRINSLDLLRAHSLESSGSRPCGRTRLHRVPEIQ